MRERGFNLRFYLESREQGYRVNVVLQTLEVLRHRLLHVFAGFLVGRFVIDQDLADVVRQVVAQRASDRVAFAVEQERRRSLEHHIENRRPDRHEILQIPRQFFGTAVDTRRSQDDAHVFGQVDLVQRFAGEVALFAGNTTRDAAGAIFVRFQDDEAAGEADKSGQRCALVTAFFLVDLDDDVLAFPEYILDVDLAAGFVFLDEILAGNFLQRQEPVAAGAVIHKRGLETGLDARDFSFVDIGFFAFASRGFDIEVVQTLAIDHGHAQLFFLSCID